MRRDSVLVVGSKALGLAAQAHLRAQDRLAGLITVDDSGDGRSAFAALVSAGATVVADRREAATAMSDIRADAVLVAGWYWMIDPAQLETRPHLGIHHSLLPRYRGGSPLVWSLIKGDRLVGTTIFTLTKEVDAGGIWAQGEVAVGKDDYIGDVLQRCDELALKLLPSALDPSATPVPQDPARATWCSPRRPEDGLIDWTMSAQDVAAWIRAQSRPYPGAFTDCDGERITIWRARPDDRVYIGRPGEVVRLGRDRIGVICGDEHPLLVEESSQPLRPGWRLPESA